MEGNSFLRRYPKPKFWFRCVESLTLPVQFPGKKAVKNAWFFVGETGIARSKKAEVQKGEPHP
jgi:hypothetical protein